METLSKETVIIEGTVLSVYCWADFNHYCLKNVLGMQETELNLVADSFP